MKRMLFSVVSFFLAAASLVAAEKTRVLIITGGHDYEKTQFYQVFKDNPEITYEAVEHPKAQAWFKSELAKQYDVILAYDMYQPITEEAKADLLGLLKDGKGLVVMHHGIASYQSWPEYWKIIGARYYLQDTVVNGVKKARSAWKHDVKFRIKIADAAHPVTKGINDFDIHDETYKGFDVADDVHPLLTTDEVLSNKVIGWAKTYEQARIVYIQLGHDHFAYENPSFRQIVRQAIRWTGKKD